MHVESLAMALFRANAAVNILICMAFGAHSYSMDVHRASVRNVFCMNIMSFHPRVNECYSVISTLPSHCHALNMLMSSFQVLLLTFYCNHKWP